MTELIERYFDIAIKSPDGIKKLRELILSLAMQGKLVPQDPNDPPASELLKEIAAEKKKLIKEGKIKKQEPLPPIKPEEVPYALPVGWEWTRLGEISLKIHYGFTASANHDLREVRLLRITDIQDNKVEWNNVPGCYIGEKDVEQYELATNDILIARTGGTVGKSYLVDEINVRAVFASYLIRCIPTKMIYVRYLKDFMEGPTYWTQLYSKCSGTGQPNVNGTGLSSLILPLPPLAEQKRIVAKVDELMALCDKFETERDARNEKRVAVQKAAVDQLLAASDEAGYDLAWEFIARNFADLYSVPENVADLKKAILQLAMQGKLVPQDPNEPPASELLKQIEVEKKRLIKEGKIKKQEPLPPIKPEEVAYALPAGWEWVRLGEIGETNIGLTYSPKEIDDIGIPVLRSNNIQNGKIDLNNLVRVNKIVNEKVHVQKGDILICARNGSKALVGKAAQIKELPEKMAFGAFMAIFRSQCNEFVEAFLNSPIFRKALDDVSTTTINQITQNNLKNSVFPLPPLAEQKRIVAKIDALMALCDELEQRLKEATDKQTAILNALVAGR